MFEIMNMKINLSISLIVILGTISSCGNSSIDQEKNVRICKLENENDSLKTELKILKKIPQDCRLIPLAYLTDYQIKNGDSAKLYINLGQIFKEERPKVLIWNDVTQDYSDTFLFGNEFSCNINFPTKNKGEHRIRGKVEYKCGNRSNFNIFETKYFVK
jgi:hypothetical protein